MDYQVLARKWRPQTFAQVVGQQHVLQALSNALTHQRLHHAYLLTGTRGVGKTTIARILAKSLNCDQGISATPCGTCTSCIEINEGRYVDLLEIDAASRTKVEDTRDLLDNVQYRPTRGRYKVYLIDEVHMLSRHSFNALLKTLEEPPEHVKFLLATTDPEKLPVTVLSRCLQFHLRALTRTEIAAQLRHILAAESLPFDDEAVGLLARAAQGSMRDALSLTDQAIAQGNQAVVLESVRNMLGHIEGRRVLALLAHVVAGDASASLQALRDMQDKVPDIAVVLPELQNALHQIALLQVSADFADTEIFKDTAQLQQLAQQLAPELVQVLYRLVIEGRRDLPHGIDAFTAVEMTLLRMLAFRPVAPHRFESTTDVAETADDVTDTPDSLAVEGSNYAQAAPDVEAAAESDAAKGSEDTIPSSEASTAKAAAINEAAASAESVPKVEEAAATFAVTSSEQPTVVAERAPSPHAPAAREQAPTASQYEPGTADRSYDTEDDDYLSPDEMAALAAEQSSIMQQAAVQHPSHSAPAQPVQAAPSTQPEQAPPPPATETGSDLERLLQTRAALLAKKKAPLTADTKRGAEVDSWSANIDKLQVKGRIRQILLNSRLRRVDDGFVLYVETSQKVLCTPQSMQEVEGLIRRLIGDANLALEYRPVPMTPLLIQQAIDHYRAENALASVKNNPRVQSLMQRFDAELDEQSLKIS